MSFASEHPLAGFEGENISNPVKSIKRFCIDICNCGSQAEREHCGETNMRTCPLYPFRFGTNPYRQKVELTEEQKAERAENLRQARARLNEKNEGA